MHPGLPEVSDDRSKRTTVAVAARRRVPRVRRPRPTATSVRNATWLILPVVICLSQRLSHACVSMN